MENMERGMTARSLAGHDRNRLYVIIRTDEEYVWLVDGTRRTVDHPKKKKKKHVQAVHRIPEPLRDVLEKGQTLCNEHIIQAIQSESRDRQEDKHV